jgi:hypothetical protein
METLTKPITGSKIRNLVTRLPIIANCIEAERLSFAFGLIYDAALQNGTVLDFTEDDITFPGRRLFAVDPGNFQPKNVEKAKIGFARLVITEFSTYLQKGRITQNKFDVILAAYGEVAARPDAEIDAILTYQDAIAMGWWV